LGNKGGKGREARERARTGEPDEAEGWARRVLRELVDVWTR
jgi:hypothetical protein